MRHILRKAVLTPYTFVLMNWAAVAGLYYFMRGFRDIWKQAGTRRS